MSVADPSGPGGPAGGEPPVAAGFEPRTYTLPDGRRLLVRALGPADVDAVLALYERLDLEDRRLRFFSAFHPPASFVRRWLDPARGLVLGAFVPPDGRDGAELVAEAGYARLVNGNGELGITVDARWRGWLGPFLLDVLAAAAHDAGVENIEADVRLDNRSMLGLIRHRGAAVVNQPPGPEVRLVMGTGGDTPGWPPVRDPARVRVLVEAASPRWSPGLTDTDLESLEVLTCPGPHARPGGRCPLLEDGHCPLVEGADAVVVVEPAGGDGPFPVPAAGHRPGSDGPPVHSCGVSAAVVELVRRLGERSGQPDRR